MEVKTYIVYYMPSTILSASVVLIHEESWITLSKLLSLSLYWWQVNQRTKLHKLPIFRQPGTQMQVLKCQLFSYSVSVSTTLPFYVIIVGLQNFYSVNFKFVAECVHNWLEWRGVIHFHLKLKLPMVFLSGFHLISHWSVSLNLGIEFWITRAHRRTPEWSLARIPARPTRSQNALWG